MDSNELLRNLCSKSYFNFLIKDCRVVKVPLGLQVRIDTEPLSPPDFLEKVQGHSRCQTFATLVSLRDKGEVEAVMAAFNQLIYEIAVHAYDNLTILTGRKL